MFRQLSSSAYDMISGAFWAQSSAGQPAGTFDIKFAPFRFVPGKCGVGRKPLFRHRNRRSDDADLQHRELQLRLIGIIPLARSGPAGRRIRARAAGSNTQNTYYQALQRDWPALWAPVQVSSGARQQRFRRRHRWDEFLHLLRDDHQRRRLTDG